MKISLRIQYKSDTGCTPFLYKESKKLTQVLPEDAFEGMTGVEIRDALSYDFKENAKQGIFIEDIPAVYVDEEDNLKLISPEYIEWLENKVEALTKP